jgi:hypothetical protein
MKIFKYLLIKILQNKKNKNYKLKKTKPKNRPHIPSTGVIIKKGLC